MSNLANFAQKALTMEQRMFKEHFSKEIRVSFDEYKNNEKNRKEIIDISIEFSAFVNKNYEVKYYVLNQYSDFEANLESIVPFARASIKIEDLIETANEYQENNEFPLFITCLPQGEGVIFVNVQESLGEISSIVDYIKENECI
ncbi:MAG: hypothetical protein U5K84_03730 [Alkalibacterium sp.]|nr:hypothetical protein [Alkalibacterium sp.]